MPAKSMTELLQPPSSLQTPRMGAQPRTASELKPQPGPQRAEQAVTSPYLGVMGAENTGVVGAAHHDLVWVLLGWVGGTGAV